jgi:hypothetical protein
VLNFVHVSEGTVHYGGEDMVRQLTSRRREQRSRLGPGITFKGMSLPVLDSLPPVRFHLPMFSEPELCT